MRLATLLLFVAACGGPSKPPADPENHADEPATKPPRFPPLPPPSCPGGERLRGHVRDGATGEPLAGATIIIVPTGDGGTTSAITDADGSYCMDSPDADVELAAYYGDLVVESKEHLGDDEVHIAADLLFDLTQADVLEERR